MSELNITVLERKILTFIDKKTWTKSKPKMKKVLERGDSGIIKEFRAKIRWTKIQFLNKGQRRFTSDDRAFEKAIHNLKANKLITSRTKCQVEAGLSCTELGHKIILKYQLNHIK